MELENKTKLKIVLIAGASKALAHKEQNPEATEGEIIQEINNNADKILRNIDEEIF